MKSFFSAEVLLRTDFRKRTNGGRIWGCDKKNILNYLEQFFSIFFLPFSTCKMLFTTWLIANLKYAKSLLNVQLYCNNTSVYFQKRIHAVIEEF